MKIQKQKIIQNQRAITLVALIVTIIILLILAGITINSLTDSELFGKVKEAKEKYSISEAKEKLEMSIMELILDKESKGEHLKREDLPLMNNDEIDVRDTTDFPVEAICGKYKFNIDENFVVTYVGEASGTIVRCSIDPEGYTNKNSVKILLKINNPQGIKTVEKPDNDIVTYNGDKQVEVNYEVTKNGRYTFKIIDGENKETDKEIVIDKIDRLVPLDFTPEVIKSGNSITINENGQDAEATSEDTKSGIDYYEYYLINEDNETTKYETNKIDGLPVGLYKMYLIAFDKAGNSKRSSTVNVNISIQFKKMIAGHECTFGIDVNDDLWAWGYNVSGQLGDGTTMDRSTPVHIKSDAKFNKVFSKNSSTYAIDTNGKLWVWGGNGNGNLGTGKKVNQYNPIKIKDDLEFKNVINGSASALFYTTSGSIFGCGCNSKGQIGNGSTAEKVTTPISIEGKESFKKISIGYEHSLGIDQNNKLWGWGSNECGKLGSETLSTSVQAIPILQDKSFIDVAAGMNYSLAIDDEGYIWAWGLNEYGNLGDGTTEKKVNPVKIEGNIRFTKIFTNVNNTNIAIDQEGNLWMWGDDRSGYFGSGTTELVLKPVKITSNVKFIDVSLGINHCFLYDDNNGIWALGNNYNNILGGGLTDDQKSPVKIQ